MSQLASFWREKLSCAYFFACPGIAYGIFTSRLPAFKLLTGANDAQIGFLLLAFGASSFCGLLGSGRLIEKLNAKWVTGIAAMALSVAITLAAIAWSYWQLLVFGMLSGLFMGLCDVAMNAQGILIEKKHHQRTISFFHACYSLGGVCGSLAGSLFAGLDLSPFLNFLVVMGAYLGFLLPAFRGLEGEKNEVAAKGENKRASRLPAAIYILGAMSLGCYVSEGSIGEWGSILLHSVKGAPQEQAALVFACFSTSMVACRFLGDALRARFSDFAIVFTGSLIGLTGMIVILLASSPVLCLACYACMGLGFGPIVPIFYSRAGALRGISPGRASSAISLMAYSGLLVFPPFIGVLAQLIGLDAALWVIVCVICGIVLGSFTLRRSNC